jgi:hypothetical protein
VIEGEILRLSKFDTKNNQTFECIADNSLDEPLRKIIHVLVSGE